MSAYKKHKKFIWGFVAGTVVGPMLVGKIAPSVRTRMPQ